MYSNIYSKHMKTRENKSRRDFLKTGSLAAAGFFIVPRHVIGRGFIAPSDKLRIAAIGAGGKGERVFEKPQCRYRLSVRCG
jgi:hypothetical protein